MILRNCNIIENDDLVIKDIRIENDIIVEINTYIDNKNNEKEIDLENNLVSPGFVDIHTHLREPGYEHKETVATASMSAAAGGYTLICAMPNTKPVMDSVEKIKLFNQIVDDSAIVKVKTFSAITESFDQGLVDIENISKVSCGFTNDGVGVQNAATMHLAMKEISKVKGLVSAHCEENSLLYGGYVHEGNKSKKENWKGINSLSESVQVARDILISEATGCKYNVCHISTKESVEQIRQAKKRGLNVSCEVTPHHLLLIDEDVKDANYKMNPPLRSSEDKKALIAGVIDGTIEAIATDHAPHSEDEKKLGIEKAPFGIVGLETAFPLIYTNFVKTNIISIKKCIELFSIGPAKIIGEDIKHISEGNVADLTVIDISTKKSIDKNKFYSKGKNTPFDGIDCYGFPVMTIVNGEIVFDDKNNYIKGEKYNG